MVDHFAFERRGERKFDAAARALPGRLHPELPARSDTVGAEAARLYRKEPRLGEATESGLIVAQCHLGAAVAIQIQFAARGL